MNIHEQEPAKNDHPIDELQQAQQRLVEMSLHIENIRKFCEIDPDSQAGRHILTYIASIPPADE